MPVPLDDPDAAGKVLYVWFDAPIGYVSFTAALCERDGGDWKDYERWWKDPDCRIVHFIGEDNTVFHALTWPAMLMAEGSYQLPWQVVANSFLNIKFPGQEEQKISKSRGTAIWIEEYLETLRSRSAALLPDRDRAGDPAHGVRHRRLRRAQQRRAAQRPGQLHQPHADLRPALLRGPRARRRRADRRRTASTCA